jgi:hypothetical protein
VKREMDLAREILLEVERSEQTMGLIDLDIRDRDDEAVAYHVMLLHEAGLLQAKNLTTNSGFDWRPVRLTWSGHEFLDAAREDARWTRAKTIMTDKAGGLSFEVLKELLLQLMRSSTLGG